MAAGGNAANVSLGPGRIYYAAVGTTTPISASAALPSADWVPVGYTEDGSELEISVTTEGVEVEEELLPVLYSSTKAEVKFKYQAAEATLPNLAVAVGAGAGYSAAATTFKFPSPADLVAVKLVWDSHEDPTTSGNRRIVFLKAYAVGTVNVARKKAPDKSTIPSEFLCAYDETEETPFIAYTPASGLI